MPQQSIIINNQLVVYARFGESNGRTPLLFLHGWRSSGQVFRSLIEKLTTHGRTCIALNLPGFGGSEPPKTTFMVSDYVEVVIAFLEKLNVPKVILVGHSFGGRVGIKIAATKPDKIEKLILVDSGGIRKDSLVRDLKTMLAKMVRPIFKLKALQSLRAKIYHLLGASDYLATPELKETYVNVVREDLQEALGQIKTPTLIVWGEKDKETPVNDGELMFEQISGSKLVVLSGAGHFSFLDKPEEFTKALTDFLSS